MGNRIYSWKLEEVRLLLCWMFYIEDTTANALSCFFIKITQQEELQLWYIFFREKIVWLSQLQ